MSGVRTEPPVGTGEVPTGPVPVKGRGMARRFLARLLRRRVAFGAFAFLVLLGVVAVLAPVIAPFEPARQDISQINAGISAEHWLGTDDLGRDVLSRIIHGARVSMLSSVFAVSLTLVVAVPLGLIAGYAGRWLDMILMRIVDGLQSIPPLILALTVTGILGPSLRTIVIALAVIFAPTFIRLVRGQALAVREETYIEASRSIGASTGYIIRKRVLHNIASPLIVQVSVTLGFALLAEAALSFLGLGIQPPRASWGGMLNRAYASIFTAPWHIFVPGFAIAITVFAFNLLGDGLRDVLGAEGHAVEERAV